MRSTRPGKTVPSILSGRVGTKQVHDAAVQMAIAFGFRFRDDLVIDTAETMRAAMSATPSMTGYGGLAPNLSASYYVYPAAPLRLAGRPVLRDAAAGGELRPVVASPRTAPWRPEWPPGGPMPIRARCRQRAGRAGGRIRSGPPAGLGGEPARGPSAGRGRPWARAPTAPWNSPPAKGDIEITVDATGQVFLRGVVASEEAAREIEQTAWSVPGVSRVVTQLQVRPRHAERGRPSEEPPPPPPQPVPPAGDRRMVPPRPDPAAAGRAGRGARPVADPAPTRTRGESPEPPPPGAVVPAAAPARPRPAAAVIGPSTASG